MTSSYNTIDTQLRTRRSSIATTTTTTNNNNSLDLSSSVHNHTMKAMLQQTKEEFNRLVQTLRSSKQTIESKQQRLQTLNKQLNDIEYEYEVILTTAKLPDTEEILKDDQYEYKDECQRKRVREKKRIELIQKKISLGFLVNNSRYRTKTKSFTSNHK
jgi:hypothetical protein